MPLPHVEAADPDDGLRRALAKHARRLHRLKLNAAAWAVGTILLTTLWAVNQWRANGALESFGHEGEPGQWNPTLWAVAVGIWALILGTMALRVRFERPATQAEVDRQVERLRSTGAAGTPLRRVARARLERIAHLRFHVAAWVLGVLLLTPLWALIEWQDNGGFERFGRASQPGEWEPWILYVAGIWALVVAVRAVRVAHERPTREKDVERRLRRLESRG